MELPRELPDLLLGIEWADARDETLQLLGRDQRASGEGVGIALDLGFLGAATARPPPEQVHVHGLLPIVEPMTPLDMTELVHQRVPEPINTVIPKRQHDDRRFRVQPETSAV